MYICRACRRFVRKESVSNPNEEDPYGTASTAQYITSGSPYGASNAAYGSSNAAYGSSKAAYGSAGTGRGVYGQSRAATLTPTAAPTYGSSSAMQNRSATLGGMARGERAPSPRVADRDQGEYGQRKESVGEKGFYGSLSPSHPAQKTSPLSNSDRKRSQPTGPPGAMSLPRNLPSNLPAVMAEPPRLVRLSNSVKVSLSVPVRACVVCVCVCVCVCEREREREREREKD